MTSSPTIQLSRVLQRLSHFTTTIRQQRTFLSRFGVTLLALAGILLLATIGWWTRSAVHHTIESQLRDELTIILKSDVSALKLWLNSRQTAAMFMARAPRVSSRIAKIIESVRQGEQSLEEASKSTSAVELRSMLADMDNAWGFRGYFVVDQAGVCVASSIDGLIGERSLFRRLGIADSALQGKAAFSHPVRLGTPLDSSQESTDLMFVEAPVPSTGGKSIAALCFWLPPDAGFTTVLQQTRTGESGETYAFDRRGLMISGSRFDDQLRTLGLIPTEPKSRSLLNLEIRNPGGNMTKGFMPNVARQAQPLTEMAARAISGESGVNVAGYPDFRGVRVVGAWQWLPEYDFGVATEMDYAEAYESLGPIRMSFYVLLAIVGLAFAAVIGAAQWASIHRRHAREAELKANKLGQYVLNDKLGEGGMGSVYLATHAMLRRPTAIKLLHHQDNDQAIQRFEREVQTTSKLTHPNTISIFDYGRTENGTFYYVMEYLEGMPLDLLVDRSGPMTEGRVIYLLRQICDSLNEAHRLGLVHRDIKPANIMICQRGGMYDFVKVLDFGLVKDIGEGQDVKLTAPAAITGTPQYLSPEAIENPESLDARSDIYAVGAVGYFMLTGTAVFDGSRPLEIIQQHLQKAPDPPSARAGRPISPDLERLIMRCLEKSREKRPRSIELVLDELLSCRDFGTWSNQEANEWWKNHSVSELQPDADPTDSAPRDQTVAYDGYN